MKSKKNSQRIHARKRALGRYGINFGPRRRSKLIRKILEGEAVFLNKISNRVKAFAVYYEDTWYPVVYDRKTEEIVTFLPSEYLERYKSLLT